MSINPSGKLPPGPATNTPPTSVVRPLLRGHKNDTTLFSSPELFEGPLTPTFASTPSNPNGARWNRVDHLAAWSNRYASPQRMPQENLLSEIRNMMQEFTAQARSSDETGSLRHTCQQLHNDNRLLTEALKESQEQLEKIQEQLLQLESESNGEIQQLRTEVDKLEGQFEDTGRQKKKLAKENEKLKEDIKTLKDYTSNLPSNDEFMKQNFDLLAKSQECEGLRNTIKTLTAKMDKLNASVAILNDDLKMWKSQCEDMRLEVSNARTIIENQDRVSQIAESLDASNVHAVVSSNNKLQQEYTNLKRLTAAIEQGKNKEIRKLESTLKEKIQQMSDLTAEVEKLNTELTDEKQLTKMLRSQVSSKIAEADREREKALKLRQELNSVRCSSELTSDVAKVESKLFNQISECVSNFRSILQTEQLLEKGQNPSASMLLGHDSFESPVAKFSLLNPLDRLQEAERMIIEVTRLQEDISGLRSHMWDKYSSVLATDNDNACTTQ